MSNIEIDTIATRHELVLYLKNLSKSNSYSDDSSISGFIEAMSAWTEDMEGYYLNRGEEIPQEPSWRIFAEIVTAALSYE